MKFHGRLKISGTYRYTENKLSGFLKFNADIPENLDGNSLETQGDVADYGDLNEV